MLHPYFCMDPNVVLFHSQKEHSTINSFFRQSNSKLQCLKFTRPPICGSLNMVLMSLLKDFTLAGGNQYPRLFLKKNETHIFRQWAVAKPQFGFSKTLQPPCPIQHWQSDKLAGPIQSRVTYREEINHQTNIRTKYFW